MTPDMGDIRAARPMTYIVALAEAYGLPEGIVLSQVALLADASGEAWITLPVIATTTGIPEAAARRIMIKLAKAGAISYDYTRAKGRVGYWVRLVERANDAGDRLLPGLNNTPEPLQQTTKTKKQTTKTPMKTPIQDDQNGTKRRHDSFGKEGGVGGDNREPGNPVQGQGVLVDQALTVPTDPVDPDRDKAKLKRFIELWFAAWQERNGAAYRLDQKDAGRIYELLKTGLSPEHLVGIAQGAWSCQCWFCSSSSTVSGFATRFRDIVAHVKAATTANDYSDWVEGGDV